LNRLAALLQSRAQTLGMQRAFRRLFVLEIDEAIAAGQQAFVFSASACRALAE